MIQTQIDGDRFFFIQNHKNKQNLELWNKHSYLVNVLE